MGALRTFLRRPLSRYVGEYVLTADNKIGKVVEIDKNDVEIAVPGEEVNRVYDVSRMEDHATSSASKISCLIIKYKGE